MIAGTDEKILGFWNERSTLGQLAGTNDFVLTEIEQRFLVDALPANSRVLDVGCGNGGSLIRMAKDKGATGVGFDFSEGMVKTARAAVETAGLSGALSIHHRGVPPVAS